MIETKLYECEYCHTSYKDKEKAKECEKNHKEIKKVVDAKYVSLNSDATGLPNKICIEFTDNLKAWYERKRII
jgi:hypothetical protein